MRSYPPQYQRSSTPLIRLLPYLSRQARRYLAIPATSALVKCLFLVAGQVVTAKGLSQPLSSRTLYLFLCSYITSKVFCQILTSLMDRLVSHNYPAGRECSLFLGLHALSLVSHRVLWDYSPQIRNVLFPDPQIQTRSKRSKKRKNRLVAQYYLLFRIKNLLDVHRFLDQSTLQLFT